LQETHWTHKYIVA